jgi:uncharacterized sulfatase
MITRMDADVGRLLDTLRELSIDQQTIVFFTSDNGPHDESKHNLERFQPSGPLRGIKRSLTEGGVRVPLLARWPGKIQPGSVADYVGYFADVLPTLSEIAGAENPSSIDGISFLPTLLGKAGQAQHAYLYWEFYEQGSRQSVRFGDWVAIRQPMIRGKVELYNVKEDIGQKSDKAAQHPALVAQAAGYMDEAHVPHENWKPRGAAGK